MARPSDGILGDDTILGTTLDRYQELMQLPPAAFNGLYREDDEVEYQCPTVWRQYDRDNLAQNLAEAEERRERELGYHLSPKYRTETQRYSQPVILEWKYLVAIGIRATQDIDLGVVLDHGLPGTPNDPVEFTVTVASGTDPDEVRVFYPGEDVEIKARVTVSGTTATIKILRSRLVKPSLNDNREPPLDYRENSNFLPTVDVKRVYTDLTGGVNYEWTYAQACLPSSLTEDTQEAKALIDDYRLSVIRMYPASSGVIVRALKYPVLPWQVNVSYLSGVQSSTTNELLTARLSHIMPAKRSPCSICWEDDVKIHESKVTTPYGNKVAAVDAWNADARLKVGQGGKFPRVSPRGYRF